MIPGSTSTLTVDICDEPMPVFGDAARLQHADVVPRIFLAHVRT